jgi:hypothetical protein
VALPFVGVTDSYLGLGQEVASPPFEEAVDSYDHLVHHLLQVAAFVEAWHSYRHLQVLEMQLALHS